jgi:hypothetical protein
MDVSAHWLQWLYGEEPLGLIWIGGHGDRFAGRTFLTIPEAVAYARELDEGATGGVYHRLTTLRDIERGRGTAGDSAYLPGFAMDLDLKGPGHKALNYPETEQDLRTLLAKACLPEPTVWVHSGGGRYPYWKLEQPADLTIPGQLERCATLSSRLHKHVMAWADVLEWKVDNTSDLARIYRLPGTLNRKTDPAVMCAMLGQPGATVSLEQMEQALADAPSPESGDDAPPFVEQSQLFSKPGPARDEDRPFTLEAALAFVQPALEKLKLARDGEINNRLRDAALQLAHFGPEFWPRQAAETQLYAALHVTVYDGATWRAQDTIDRAYADVAGKPGPDYWHATLIRPSLEDAAETSSWLPVDMQPVLDGQDCRPVPTMGRRSDGLRLLYPGKEHSISSEPECGKTWWVLLQVLSVLQDGGRVVYIDFEDDQYVIGGRLISMGGRAFMGPGQFRYVRPDTAPPDEAVGRLCAFDDGVADLVVLDGVTEGMGLMGLDIVSNRDITAWRSVAKKAMRLGAAVLSTDHETKSKDTRGRFAIGGGHKLAGLNGVMFKMENVRPLNSASSDGLTRVYFTKDRNGRLRENATTNDKVQPQDGLTHLGDLRYNHETQRWDFYPPKPAKEDAPGAVPRDHRERVAKIEEWLKANPAGGPKIRIKAAIGGRGTLADQAVEWMLADGRLKETKVGNSKIITFSDAWKVAESSPPKPEA